ncbi:hypothetical protein [Streptomyces sp. NPDC086989]|uniref:hypothetical protein n=1 Tax=Streptomyces sp. NPDC086989 TaxID=3365764 RepID=UPI0037F96015
MVALTDPLQRTTVFGRDDEGRLVTVVRPDGRELITEYEEAGRPVLHTEADRTSWRFTYDERHPSDLPYPPGGGHGPLPRPERPLG